MRDLPPARTIEQIDAEIAATNTRLAQLEIERAEAVDAKRCAIIKAFDDGARRAQILDANPGLTYRALACILNRAGRTEKQRQALGLNPKQKIEYRRLTRAGVSSRAARNIALAIGAPT